MYSKTDRFMYLNMYSKTDRFYKFLWFNSGQKYLLRAFLYKLMCFMIKSSMQPKTS